MKKILLVSLFLSFSMAFADVDFTNAIKSTRMPTDAEIKNVIQQFDFTGEQADAVFKEVKAKLKELYLSQNYDKANVELNRYLNQLNSEAVGVFMDETLKQQLLMDMSKVR